MSKKITFTAKPDLLSVIGRRIKRIRRSKGLKQVQLAALCHFEKATLSKIESGLVNISYLTLHRLSQGLNISIAELVADDTADEQKQLFLEAMEK